MIAIDQIDARILELAQRGIPVAREPYHQLATRVSTNGADVISRLDKCRREGLVRRLGAIVDSSALGYTGALIAFRVRQDRLDMVGEAVAAHALVSHCYSRDGLYNLWFTLTSPPGENLDAEVGIQAQQDGVEKSLVLPAVRVFKLGVYLRLCDPAGAIEPDRAFENRPTAAGAVGLSETDRAALGVLQDELPLVARPFACLAERAGLTENELIDSARSLLEKGVIRRFVAVLNHRQAGYTHNAMVCWQISSEKTEAAGYRLAEDAAVSHCYQRHSFPEWPYPVYTMIHCRDAAELDETVGRLAAACGDAPHVLLRTLREYKKSRSRYAVV